VLSASTGVIGHRLPAAKIVAAAPVLAQSLRPEPERAAEAILTTDTRIKMAARTVRIGGKDATISAICKGSGMIAPSLATMIAVVTTDAAVGPTALAGAPRAAPDRRRVRSCCDAVSSRWSPGPNSGTAPQNAASQSCNLSRRSPEELP